MRRGDKEFVIDMFLSCQKIIEYIERMSFEDFERDTRTVDAVIRKSQLGDFE